MTARFESSLECSYFDSAEKDPRGYLCRTPTGKRPICKEYSSGGNCRGAQGQCGPTKDACNLHYGELAYIPPDMSLATTVYIHNETGEILTLNYRNRNYRSKPLIYPGANTLRIQEFSPPELGIFRTIEAYPQYKGGLNYNTQLSKQYESAWQTLTTGNTYRLSISEGRILVDDRFY